MMTTLAPVLASSFTPLDGIAHGFFTRTGGVSEGLYRGLNCGIGSHDTPEHVRENRNRVAAHLGADSLNSLYQIHSADVVTITQPWLGTPPQADALVTKVPLLGIGVLTADCVPVLFCDPQARVIGAAHAGWKGAIAGITDATLTAMEALGAQRSHIYAAIGPCIGFDSYEVSASFLTPFMEEDTSNQRFFNAGQSDKYFFDIRRYVEAKLAKAGINLLEVLPHDTYTLEADFFSYRRTCHRSEPDYGRQISAIMLKH